MDLVEQIGSGMSRILKAYDRSIFELSPGFTVVTFPFAEAFAAQYGKINGKINTILVSAAMIESQYSRRAG